MNLYDANNVLVASAVADSFGIWQANVDLSAVAVGSSITLTATQTLGGDLSLPTDEFIITRSMPNTVEPDVVVDLNIITGDAIVTALANIGDINHDGINDVLVGPGNLIPDSSNNYYTDDFYVLFGKQNGGWGSFDAASGQWKVDPASLSPEDGFVINNSSGDLGHLNYYGASLDDYGDVNGDGIDDIALWWQANSSNVSESRVYVLFGKEGEAFGAFDAASGRQVFDLAGLTSSDGFVISDSTPQLPTVSDTTGNTTTTTYYYGGPGVGAGVHALGDIDGDGHADLIGSNIEYSTVSTSTSTNDGTTTTYTSTNVATYSSIAYVVFGKDSASPFGGGVDIASLAPGAGFIITDSSFSGGNSNQTNTSTGTTSNSNSTSHNWVVSSAGNVNDDAYDDLIVVRNTNFSTYTYDGVTTTNENERSITAYVVFGKAGGAGAFGAYDPVSGQQVLDLASFTANDGFVIQAQTQVTSAYNLSANSIGDINGDGHDDLMVATGEPNDNDFMDGFTTTSYIVFGKENGAFGELDPVSGQRVLDLDSLAPTDGFRIQGEIGSFYSTPSASIGDFNQDGLNDFIVGSLFGGINEEWVLDHPNGEIGEYLLDNEMLGRFYIVYGKEYDTDGTASNPFGSLDAVSGQQVLNIDTLAGDEGFGLSSSNMSWLGWNVASAGDINDDGYADFSVTGMILNLEDLNNPVLGAAAYIYFGGPAGFASEDYLASITRFGAGSDDWLIGSDVNDVLNGGGGVDVLLAYSGNDTIAVTDGNFLRVDGGAGTDTLALSGSGALIDFAALEAGRVIDIERLNLNGSGANQVSLDLQSVLAMSSSTDTVIVRGGSDDTVNLAVADGFVQTGYQTISGVVYYQYEAGSTTVGTVLIEDGVNITGAPPPLEPLLIKAMSNDYATLATEHKTPADHSVLSGTAEAGAAITIYNGANAVASAVADSAGIWQASVDLSAVAVGNSITLTATQTIGGISSPPATGFTIARTTPVVDLMGADIVVDLGLDTDGQLGSMVNAGDINHDGINDLVIGANHVPGTGADGPNDYAELYVLFGKESGGWGSFDAVSGQWKVSVENLAPSDGFVINKPYPSGLVNADSLIGSDPGSFLTHIGDVNGDTIDDLAVRWYEYQYDGSSSATYTSQVYVVFGKEESETFGAYDSVSGRQVLDLNSLTTSDGFIINDSGNINGLDASVSASDINGDGHADLIGVDLVRIPTSYYDETTSEFVSVNTDSSIAYVVFGKDNASPFGSGLDIASLAPADGFVINDSRTYSSNITHYYDVFSAGNINGDGYGDLVLTSQASSYDDSTTPYTTDRQLKAYVLYGKNGGFGAYDADSGRQVLDLASFTPSDGFVIQTEWNTADSQLTVTSIGDINGDGHDDLIVALPRNDGVIINGTPPINTSYVIFGKQGGTFGQFDQVSGQQVLDLDNLAPTDGFLIQGASRGELLGYTVAGVGDFNEDGINDFMLGAPTAGINWEWLQDNLGNLPPMGFSLLFSEADYAGQFYMVYGKEYDTGATAPNPFGSLDVNSGQQVLDLANLSADEGFFIRGDADLNALSILGYMVSSAGDINDDGHVDFAVMSAGFIDAGGPLRDVVSGKAYIYFGGDENFADPGSIARVGTASDDWLTGSETNDVLNGNAGGADVLLAYGGDDLLAVGDAGFLRVDGGAGFDTLALSGSGIVLDFSALAADAVLDIEKLNIDGTGANTVKLTLQDVLDVSGGADELVIDGGSDDTVEAVGFAAAGTQQIGDKIYNAYVAQSGPDMATLLIEDTITNIALL
ncbi:MAG: hypothetical protein LBE33_04810 [Zoogloeaceae bacterium]|nr:hypothetical protein [Zoogloeaceae bacterium]